MFTRVDRRARAAPDWRSHANATRLCGRIVTRPLERSENKIKYRIVFKSIGVFVRAGTPARVCGCDVKSGGGRVRVRALTRLPLLQFATVRVRGAPALVCGGLAWIVCWHGGVD